MISLTSMDFLLLQNSQFDIVKILSDLVGQFASAIPNVVGAILVFLVGWLIAKLGARLLKRLFRTIGVDKLAERLNEIELVHKANFKLVPSELLAKIFYYIIILIFAIAATDILGMPAVSELMSDIINYMPSLLTAGIVLFIGVLFADFIKNVVLTTCRSLGIPSASVIANFVFYFLFIAVVMSALGQARVNTDFLRENLTIIIAGGVLAFAFGYGFASRDMMANFIASFYSRNKVKIGDLIRIEEVEGEVIAMDSSSVTVRGEGKQVIIPLSKLTSKNVEILDDPEDETD